MTLDLVAFVDDDDAVRAATSQTLRLAGLQPLVFDSAHAALSAISANFAGIVVSDVRMPLLDGFEFHRRLKAADPELPVILVTGHGDVEDAVAAIKSGAYDFITKPFAPDRLIASIMRALAYRSVILDNRRLLAAAADTGPDVPILGEAPAIVALRATVRQLADTDANVLIEGEPGVGKEHVARVLHLLSRRGRRAFSVVECGALPDTMIADDVYGQSPRAPGVKPRSGKVETADGGTLFLHDIDAASPALQAALARVLEERAIPLPDSADIKPVSFRAIGASSQDLAQKIRLGAFRPDLYYGLAMVRLTIPPLRERRGDIPLLFATFQADAARRLQRPAPALTDAVRRRLIDHDWPGNQRELQHFAEQTVLGLDRPGEAVAADELSLPERVSRFEEGVIRDALKEAKGDVRTVLESLRIPRKTFYDKLVRHRINIDDYRSG